MAYYNKMYTVKTGHSKSIFRKRKHQAAGTNRGMMHLRYALYGILYVVFTWVCIFFVVGK